MSVKVWEKGHLVVYDYVIKFTFTAGHFRLLFNNGTVRKLSRRSVKLCEIISD